MQQHHKITTCWFLPLYSLPGSKVMMETRLFQLTPEGDDVVVDKQEHRQHQPQIKRAKMAPKRGIRRVESTARFAWMFPWICYKITIRPEFAELPRDELKMIVSDENNTAWYKIVGPRLVASRCPVNGVTAMQLADLLGKQYTYLKLNHAAELSALSQMPHATFYSVTDFGRIVSPTLREHCYNHLFDAFQPREFFMLCSFVDADSNDLRTNTSENALSRLWEMVAATDFPRVTLLFASVNGKVAADRVVQLHEDNDFAHVRIESSPSHTCGVEWYNDFIPKNQLYQICKKNCLVFKPAFRADNTSRSIDVLYQVVCSNMYEAVSLPKTAAAEPLNIYTLYDAFLKNTDKTAQSSLLLQPSPEEHTYIVYTRLMEAMHAFYTTFAHQETLPHIVAGRIEHVIAHMLPRKGANIGVVFGDRVAVCPDPGTAKQCVDDFNTLSDTVNHASVFLADKPARTNLQIIIPEAHRLSSTEFITALKAVKRHSPENIYICLSWQPLTNRANFVDTMFATMLLEHGHLVKSRRVSVFEPRVTLADIPRGHLKTVTLTNGLLITRIMANAPHLLTNAELCLLVGVSESVLIVSADAPFIPPRFTLKVGEPVYVADSSQNVLAGLSIMQSNGTLFDVDQVEMSTLSSQLAVWYKLETKPSASISYISRKIIPASTGRFTISMQRLLPADTVIYVTSKASVASESDLKQLVHLARVNFFIISSAS